MQEEGRSAGWQPKMGPQNSADEEPIATPWRTRHNQALGTSDDTTPDESTIALTRGGAAVPPEEEPPQRRRRGGALLVLLLIALLLLTGLGALFLNNRGGPTFSSPNTTHGASLTAGLPTATATTTTTPGAGTTVTVGVGVTPSASTTVTTTPSVTATATATTTTPEDTATPAPPPVLSVSPTTANASCLTGNYPTITVLNTGGSPLNWSASSASSPPLVITPASGTIAPGSTAQVTIGGTIVRLSVVFNFTSSNGGKGTVTFTCL